MMISEDEQDVGELKKLLGQTIERVTNVESDVRKIQVRQDEQEEEIKEVKYDLRAFKRVVMENNRGWNVAKTLGIVGGAGVAFGIIWVLLAVELNNEL
jgi:hypothetical protein